MSSIETKDRRIVIEWNWPTLLILLLAFYGEPDLWDAIIFWLMGGAV